MTTGRSCLILLVALASVRLPLRKRPGGTGQQSNDISRPLHRIDLLQSARRSRR